MSKMVNYQIAHQGLGRFRFKIPRLGYDADYGVKLSLILSSLSFILSVRFNVTACSVILTYDCDVISSGIVKDKVVDCIMRAPFYSEIPTEPSLTAEVNWLSRLGVYWLTLFLSVLVLLFEFPVPLIVLFGLMGISLFPMANRAINGLTQEQKLRVDLLDSLWVVANTVRGQYVAPSLMMTLAETGGAIRDESKRLTEQERLVLLRRVNGSVWVQRNGRKEKILGEDVVRGDEIEVYPGELILVDGMVVRGSGLINQYNLTGDGQLISVYPGSNVAATTQLVQGQLLVVAQGSVSETRSRVINKLITEGDSFYTRMGNGVLDWADSLVAPTLALVGGLLLMGHTSGAIASLQLDFGTGIKIAIPTPVLSALRQAALMGVYVRNGYALEMLTGVDTILLGSTGTLTGVEAMVQKVLVVTGFRTRDLLRLAASASQKLNHPLSMAIVNYARGLSIDPWLVSDYEYEVGRGVRTKVNGQVVHVGSARYFDSEGIGLDGVHEEYADLVDGVYIRVYVALQYEAIGVILLSNPLRGDSVGLVNELRGLGITPYLITGQNEVLARSIGARVGIGADCVFSELSPDEKVERVRALKAEGKMVAYMGNELSDHPVLDYTDVAISITSWGQLTTERADILIVSDDLMKLIVVINLAKRALEVVGQNIAMVAIPNVSVVLAGIFWGLHPIAAVIINNCAALMAEMNGYREV